MAGFNDGVEQDAQGLDAGEILAGHVNNTDGFTTFESGLNVGRFAKYDAGSLDNLDGSGTPKIAGIVKRNLTGDLSKTVFDTEDDIAELGNLGYMTIDVVTGLSPAKYGAVYAENAGVNAGADYGKATTLATGNQVVTNADFWEEIKTDVWVVRLKQVL